MYLFPETEEQRKKRLAQGRLSLTDQFTRALASGTLDLGTTLGTGLTWAGFPELGEPVRKFFTEASSDYGPTPDIEGSILDKPELLANPSWYVYNTAKFLPSQIPTMGAGAAAYAGMRGLGAGAKAAGIGAAATGGAVGGLMEGTGAYQAAKERGMSESEARRAGLGMAAGSAVLNSIPLARMFGPGTMLKRIGASAFSEGITEAAEEPWQSLMTGEPVTEGLKRAVDVFIPAALGGGMGAVSVKPVVNRDYAKDTPTAKLMGDILKRSKSPDVDAFNEQAKQAYKAAVDAVGDAAVPRETIDQAVASELRPTFRKLLQATAKAEGLPEAAVMFSKAGEKEAAKPFYSAALKATEAIKQERGTPEQMLAQIKKTPGVKQEELDWIGLDQWMKEQKGPVTKQQIADFVRQNQVDVQEVVKGGESKIKPAYYSDDVRWGDTAVFDSRDEAIQVAMDSFDLGKEEAAEFVDDAKTTPPDDFGVPATKFANWQLPGGKNYRELLLTLPEKPTSFKSGHFDEPNILAHVRFNDRTDADGKRVLFLEEVQSDWGQQYRKYQDQNTDDLETALRQVDKNPVPSAPFVKNTSSWSMLAMKRMLRYAAENGYDRIAWTTGDQQADRYDLSKQVDNVRAFRREDGTYDLSARSRDGTGPHDIATAIKPEKIAEYVGKDLAEKITKQGDGWKQYSGVDLKVGGEGMRAFYDRMLPNELNKYVKKWNAKVGATTLPEIDRVNAIDITPQMRDSVMQGQPMFARTQQQAPGMPDHHVQAIVDSLTKNWKNAPQVVVAPSMDYAPEYARRNASVRGGETGVKGFFDENTGAVWIISSMARDAADVQRTLFHESFGHYGLRLLGDDAMPILRDVYARYKNDLADIARDYQLDLENSHEHRLLAAEEKLAQLAEAHKDTGLLNRVYAYIRRALRNMGWTSLKVSDAEIRDLLTRMAKGVREGNQSLEGGTDSAMFTREQGQTLEGLRERWKQKGVEVDAYASKDGRLTLSRLVVDKAKRGQGVGTSVMEELARYADETGQTLVLSPSTDFGGSSVARLKAFYKRFGFVENKGKYKDFTTSESMYRAPKAAHRVQTGTPEFRAWFGDSKVTDKNGDPLVMYHGTAKDFSTFDNSKTGANDSGLWGRGHYFSATPTSANSYALRQGDGATLVPVYLSIQNPLMLRTGKDLVTRLPNGTNTRHLIGDNLDGSKIKAIALRGGHDGIVQIKPDGSIGDAVAFLPEQIKSAIGNRGTFDPSQKDIRFSLAPNRGAGTLQGEDKYARPSSVNLNTLNSAEDVQALTRSMAKQFEGQVDEAKRGVMTVEEINRLAREIGEDPKFLQDFLTRKAGDAYSAEYLRAAQQLHRQSAQMTSKMIDEYLQKQKANQLSDSDRANMWEQIQRHALVLSQYSGVATEAGRALRILREDAQDVPGAQWKQREIDALIEGAGGRANLDGVVATIAAARDSGQANKALAKAVEATFFDKVIEAWINGLLSGPQTHAANAFSNALVQLMQDAEAFVAAGVGTLHGGDKYLARQAVARLKAWVPGVLKGMGAAWQALKSEEAVDLFGRLESGHRAAIEGVKGKVIRLPGRVLNAADMGFKALTISKYLAEQAVAAKDSVFTKEAETLGKSVKYMTIDEKMSALTKNKKFMEQAWEDARYSTFTNDLGDIGKSVTALANRHPWMRFIMPFIRTPTNIVKFAAHRSPIGVMTPTFRAMWKEGGATRDVAVARVVMGSAVMATAAMLAKAGLLSGSGPEDPRKRATLRATGWAPYSMKIGDTWYSFQRFEPLSMLLGIAADVAELNERMTDKEISDIAAMGAISFFSNITSKTYLRGLSDAFNAVTQPERYGSNWIAGYAGSAVPTGVAQLARMRDPYLREANGIMQKVQARIPVAREQLLKKRDVFGEPIANQGGVLFDTIPMYKSAVTRDVVAEELVRLDVRVSGVGSTIAKHKLTDEEQNQYEMFYGRLMKRMLEMRIRSPGWRNIPDAKKIEMIEDSTQEARKLARQMVVARNPTIMTR